MKKLSDLLINTGLFVDNDEEQTNDVPVNSSISQNKFVTTTILSSDKYYDVLNQKLSGISQVYAKYQQAYAVMESVPFPDNKLRIQAALASAGVTATDVVNAINKDFMTVLNNEKSLFTWEVSDKTQIVNDEYNNTQNQLTTEKQRLEKELTIIENRISQSHNSKQEQDNELNTKVKNFDIAFKQIETQFSETISLLSQLK